MVNYLLLINADLLTETIDEISEIQRGTFIVHSIDNSADQIAQHNEKPIDVIIMQAPDYGEIVQTITEIRKHKNYQIAPIILITDLQQYIQIQKHTEFGAIDYISNPSDKLNVFYRVRYNLNLSFALRSMWGENKNIKVQLSELEKLRIHNEDLSIASRRLEEINQQLEEQHTEIMRQKIEIENQKRKSEELLLNILPEETARELMIHGSANPQFYTRATVMFTDFCNFTTLCQDMTPQEVIEELDRYFSKFDEICEEHFVEKIKTIGDSYMCVGGVPMRNNSNPVDVILAALQIEKYMRQINNEKEAAGKAKWELRIGIHTGNIIAGVIGKKKFAYDIWGDTVNTASRLETGSLPGRINISGTTYDLAKNFFTCTYRGKIPAKNKGDIDMYFVEGILPQLSKNEDGITPNRYFDVALAKL